MRFQDLVPQTFPGLPYRGFLNPQVVQKSIVVGRMGVRRLETLRHKTGEVFATREPCSTTFNHTPEPPMGKSTIDSFVGVRQNTRDIGKSTIQENL